MGIPPRGSPDLPTVFIILVNWNDYEGTSSCLDSLSEIKYPDYEVIVVDNDSTDGSGQRILEEFGWCHVIFNETNEGFSGGVNLGIRKALKNDVEYLLVLNNDTVVKPTFLKPLVQAAEMGDRIAIVTGIIKYKNSKEIQSAGRSFNKRLVKSPHWKSARDTSPYETECVSGALALFSREFLKENGLLDESYFFGMEDVEISWRARCEGWKLIVSPDSIVYHEGGMTSNDSPFTWYHRIYGRLQFASDYHNYFDALIFFIFMLMLLARNSANWLLHRRTNLMKSVILAVFDFLCGNEPSFKPT